MVCLQIYSKRACPSIRDNRNLASKRNKKMENPAGFTAARKWDYSHRQQKKPGRPAVPRKFVSRSVPDGKFVKVLPKDLQFEAQPRRLRGVYPISRISSLRNRVLERNW